MCFYAGLEGATLLLVHMILLLPFLQNLYCPLPGNCHNIYRFVVTSNVKGVPYSCAVLGPT